LDNDGRDAIVGAVDFGREGLHVDLATLVDRLGKVYRMHAQCKEQIARPTVGSLSVFVGVWQQGKGERRCLDWIILELSTRIP
jgi:hypothetical protein